MTKRIYERTGLHARMLFAMAAGVAISGALLAGCDSEPVGHSKTTTKTVKDTPTEKTTVTETHQKDTTITPR